jgi:hypothetical protein
LNKCEPPGRVPEKGRERKKTTHSRKKRFTTTFKVGLYGKNKKLKITIHTSARLILGG